MVLPIVIINQRLYRLMCNIVTLYWYTMMHKTHGHRPSQDEMRALERLVHNPANATRILCWVILPRAEYARLKAARIAYANLWGFCTS